MLTFPRLLSRNLLYHWRGNLAVLLGVAVGAAVLTGALLVGDSLRGSLRERAERQLAGIDAAAIFPRPVRAAVADGMPGKTAPVLLQQGSIEKVTPGDDADAPAIGRVTVLGVDDRFKPAGVDPAAVDWNADPRSAVLSARVADRLGVKAGDRVRLGLQTFSDLPRATLLAKRSLNDVTSGVTLTVAAILPPESSANDFNLTPNPAAPLNVYVPLKALSESLEDDPNARPRPPTKANALLSSAAPVAELNAALKSHLTLDDYGIRVRVPKPRGKYVAVEPESLLMDGTTAKAVERAAADLGLRSERTLVYLVNSISHGSAEIPYSVVAALNPSAAPPLGPFLPPGVSELKDGEIVLADWPESPLRGLPPGTELKITYFHPEIEGEGKVETVTLTLRGYVAMTGAADDRDLTPPVKGITDENANIFNWDRPPQLTNARIKEKIKPGDIHEAYWKKYRGTPKAYVNLSTGGKLFGSRYGSATSIRVAPAAGETPSQTAERLKPVILNHLDPSAAGLIFDPIRDRLLSASRGGTDFGGLFLGFSLFLIAAALMLVGLLFRLSLDRRAKEVGLLLATGYAVRHVRRLALVEGLILAAIGAAVGLLAAVEYNRLLLRVLLDLWPDREVGTFLKPHATAASFGIGFGLAVVMALGALWLSVRGLVKVAPPSLLRGETVLPLATLERGSRYGRLVILVSLPLGLGLIVAGRFIDNPDYRAMTFFGGGALLLTAGLAAMWVWMKRSRHAEVNGRGLPALGQLGTRNAARNPSRSLLTTALLAAAAFLLVAVESFRREPGREFLDINGGSGGFNLIAEADVPIFQSFDSGPGRGDLDDRLVRAYGRTTTDPRYVRAMAELDALKPAPDGTPNVFPLRLRAGDDASCLNLFQASRPRILGVPDSLVNRGGFKFYETEAATPEEKANPWLLLKKPAPNGAVPVFAENNTAVWMLKTGVGGEVKMPDDAGNEVTLRIVGTLVDSPFQSELIMSDENFVKLFPKQDGYRVFLIRTPPGMEQEVGRVLEVGLRQNGLGATPTRDRVAAYQAVIGAYLSTFQLLGGFGLLLGVLGLAVVILRGVWERLGELALLRAVGYRTRALQFLVLAEHAVLLVAGLAAGVLAALASVAPHVADGASVPWARLLGLLGLVLVVGMGVASAATAGILRVPVIPALRRE
ncbi:MAG: FtsX-like permease family protein [Gemmataceae bacterium]|nr:FtsX-like permease family protein [Gemmataceae bacterium]